MSAHVYTYIRCTFHTRIFQVYEVYLKIQCRCRRDEAVKVLLLLSSAIRFTCEVIYVREKSCVRFTLFPDLRVVELTSHANPAIKKDSDSNFIG